MTGSRIALVLAAAVYVVALVVAGTALPERVPLHFDAAGEADAFGPRAAALAFWALVGAGMLLLFWLLPALVRRSPMSLFNVPHQEWWTATPERSRRLRTLLCEDLTWIGAATLLLLAALLMLTTRAARADPPRLSGWSWVVLAVYLTVILTYVALASTTRYRPPPARKADRAS